MNSRVGRQWSLEFAAYFAATFGVMWCIFMVGDLGDHARMISNHPWAQVVQLYAYKTVVIASMVVPAAMVFAAAVLLAVKKRRGEILALQSLGAGFPRALGLTWGMAFLLAMGNVAFDDRVLTQAGPEVDLLQISNFGRWSDARLWYERHSWFRVKNYFFYLPGDHVTVFEVNNQFQVVRRIDANEMRYVGNERWFFDDAQVRLFSDDSSVVEHLPQIELSLPGTTPESFSLATGRPEYMRWSMLKAQIDKSRRLGLPTIAMEWARLARLLSPLLAALSVVVLSIVAWHTNRKGQLATAFLEATLVCVALWTALVVLKSLVTADRLTVKQLTQTIVFSVGVLLVGLRLVFYRGLLHCVPVRNTMKQ